MDYATHAEIDLLALADNIAALRERAGGRAMLAAVKANAYGHGAVPLARFMESEHLVDMLGVATVPEALELRAAGITTPILKLSQCFAPALDHAISHDVTLTVVDQRTISEADHAARQLGRCAPVHLKIDTGMGRIGAAPSEAVELARQVVACDNLSLEGIFTHLAFSDSPEGNGFTSEQQAIFDQTVEAVEREVGAIPWVHVSNSGGLVGHDQGRTTLVRPGISLYGYYPDVNQTPRTIPLRPIMAVRSRVSYLKQVPAGTTIGYGRTWQAEEPTWIATVPIGYADGYSRLNSNRGRMLINGSSYPIAGRVCMDQTMLNLGPENPGVKVGDQVTVMGRDHAESIDADELAAIMGTISYEVTCLVSTRMSRIYLH